MNSVNKLMLRFVLLPSAFYKKTGVNTSHLRAILHTKLLMDDRRPNTFQQVRQHNKEEKEISNATLGTIFISTIVGLFLLISFLYGTDYTTKLTFFFSMFIFMLAGTLIADFTTVLIDVKDNLIILPKPVNDKTVVLARLLHIFIHMSKLVIPMTAPAIILIGVLQGIGGALLMLPLIFSGTLITVFVINAVYLVILRFSNPVKFKNFITYFQIFFGVLIFAFYQILPRMIDRVQLEKIDINHLKWIWALPSYWLGKTWQTINDFAFSTNGLLAVALTVTAPFILTIIVIKFFAPSFNRKLSMIAGSSETNSNKSLINVVQGVPQRNQIADIFTKNKTEKAGFLICQKMMGRSRDFKLKVYPAFGYMIVFAFLLFFRKKTSLLSSAENDDAAIRFIFITVAYMSSLLLSTALQNIAASDKYKAAWIFLSTPVHQPGFLISGAVKACIVRFFLPAAFIISAVSIFLWGIEMIPNLLLAFFNQILFALINSLIFLNKLPFSVPVNLKASGGSFLYGIIILIIVGVLAGIHFFLFKQLMIVSILTVITAAGCYVLLKQIQKKDWYSIQLSYNG